MQEYRLFVQASNGRPVGEPEVFEAASDEAAISRARSRGYPEDAELWADERLVALVKVGGEAPWIPDAGERARPVGPVSRPIPVH